jgi:hypothetical protein
MKRALAIAGLLLSSCAPSDNQKVSDWQYTGSYSCVATAPGVVLDRDIETSHKRADAGFFSGYKFLEQRDYFVKFHLPAGSGGFTQHGLEKLSLTPGVSFWSKVTTGTYEDVRAHPDVVIEYSVPCFEYTHRTTGEVTHRVNDEFEVSFRGFSFR